jgi:DNA-binding GntR family transcriptional regulator
MTTEVETIGDMPEENEKAGNKIAYRELAGSLREALERGEFADGRPLPTETDLSDEYQLSRHTVRRALQELVSEGLIYRVRGRGTFATAVVPGRRYVRSFGSVDDLMAYSLDTNMTTIAPLERQVDVEAAGRLRLDSDEVMAAILLRSHADVPFCLTRLFLPLDVGIALAGEKILTQAGQTTAKTVISAVERATDRPIAGAHQSVAATKLERSAAELIDCDETDPVLRIDRIYYDIEGSPLELAISHFNPNRYSYRLELTRQLQP